MLKNKVTVAYFSKQYKRFRPFYTSLVYQSRSEACYQLYITTTLCHQRNMGKHETFHQD